MIIYIKGITDLCVDIDENIFIYDLIKKLNLQYDISLYYNGKRLDNNRMLSDYNIKNNNILTYLINQKG